MHSHPDHQRFASPLARRSAFTMVELLVAIMIIAILASLILGVLGTTGQKARVNSTKATIGQIDRVLQERYQKFLAEITEQERKGGRSASWDNILGSAVLLVSSSNGAIDIETAKVLIKEDRYRGWFPQRIADLYGPNQSTGGSNSADDSPLMAQKSVPAPPNYVNESPIPPPPNNDRLTVYAWQFVNPTRSASAPPGQVSRSTFIDFSNNADTESAELLYFLLTEGADGINSTLQNDVNPRHIGDTDQDGLPEFLDDWGHPLRFYNAPTSMYADTSITAALLPGVTTSDADPLDPGNLIGSNSNVSAFFQLYNTSFAASYHAPGVNFIPLIVSAGPDEDLGLYEPNNTSGPATRLGGVKSRDAAMDNITNRQTGAP